MDLKKLFVLMLSVGMVAQATVRDHAQPSGSVDELQRVTARLYSGVYYSTLHPHVKASVGSFYANVQQLDRCVDYYPLNDHTGPGIPAACYGYLSSVQQSFYPVEQYLYDTNWDYPHIYRSYLQVRAVLNDLR